MAQTFCPLVELTYPVSQTSFIRRAIEGRLIQTIGLTSIAIQIQRYDLVVKLQAFYIDQGINLAI
ncbi:hypothetical protein [Undibacterium sp. Ji49W]|uniref:hypothetical protein n=1 Tax=Undibacterium sp. Ji49W TaxID=3413040 RepID=UPI003BF2DE71